MFIDGDVEFVGLDDVGGFETFRDDAAVLGVVM